LPLNLPGGTKMSPRRHPPKLRPVDRGGGVPSMNFPLSKIKPSYTDVVSDDVAEIWLQYSTQWDSLAHVGQEFDISGTGQREIVYYNGFRAHEDVVGHFDHVSGQPLESD